MAAKCPILQAEPGDQRSRFDLSSDQFRSDEPPAGIVKTVIKHVPKQQQQPTNNRPTNNLQNFVNNIL